MLLVDYVNIREAGLLKNAQRCLAAHAVHGGVDDRQRFSLAGTGHVGEFGKPVGVGLEHLVAQFRPAGVRQFHAAGGGHLGDFAGNERIEGFDDLRAGTCGERFELSVGEFTTLGVCGSASRTDEGPLAKVDLVAVVLGRVVAGGDHDTGIGAQVLDRKGQQRCGQLCPQEHGVATGLGDDGGGDAGEVS